MFSYDMTMANACESLARRWLDCNDEQLGEFTYQDIAGFLPLQVEQFLAAFLNYVSLLYLYMSYYALTYSQCSLCRKFSRLAFLLQTV